MGPVLLDIPRDLLPGAEVELEPLPPDAYRPGQTRSRGDLGLVQKAADVLASAQRPVILAGGGVQWSNAGGVLCRLAELTGAAIVTSYGRADAVPSDHPNFLGHLGRLGAAEGIEATREADVILAVGTRLGQSTTFYDNRFIPADARIIQIEIDPEEIGRNYPVTVGIEGDAGAVTEGILEELRQREPRVNPQWAEEVKGWAARRVERLRGEERLDTLPMKPSGCMPSLGK